jgi:hypothetical protein
LTWSQLSEMISPERLEGISLWPESFSKIRHLHYVTLMLK